MDTRQLELTAEEKREKKRLDAQYYRGNIPPRNEARRQELIKKTKDLTKQRKTVKEESQVKKSRAEYMQEYRKLHGQKSYPQKYKAKPKREIDYKALEIKAKKNTPLNRSRKVQYGSNHYKILKKKFDNGEEKVLRVSHQYRTTTELRAYEYGVDFYNTKGNSVTESRVKPGHTYQCVNRTTGRIIKNGTITQELLDIAKNY